MSCWRKRGGRRMMRDSAGAESSSDVLLELESAGSGDGDRAALDSGCGGGGDLPGVDVTGNDDNRLRPPLSLPRPDPGMVGRGDELSPSLSTAVLVEALREMTGRIDVFNGVPGELPYLRGRGLPRCTDAAEVGRTLLLPTAGSDPGVGDGAAEPLAAAVALRT